MTYISKVDLTLLSREAQSVNRDTTITAIMRSSVLFRRTSKVFMLKCSEKPIRFGRSVVKSSLGITDTCIRK